MQEYKLVVRTITTGATRLDGTNLVYQNAGEFVAYLNEAYLSKEYVILKADLLRTLPAETPMDVPKYEFAYHLVKELSTNKAK